MLKSEFEKLIGREISQQMYDSIEKVYMSLPDVTKEEFAEMYMSSPRLYADIAELSRRVHNLTEKCKAHEGIRNYIGEQLLGLRLEDPRINVLASSLMGEENKLKFKILNGIELTEGEKQQVEQLFNNQNN